MFNSQFRNNKLKKNKKTKQKMKGIDTFVFAMGVILLIGKPFFCYGCYLEMVQDGIDLRQGVKMSRESLANTNYQRVSEDNTKYNNEYGYGNQNQEHNQSFLPDIGDPGLG